MGNINVSLVKINNFDPLVNFEIEIKIGLELLKFKNNLFYPSNLNNTCEEY